MITLKRYFIGSLPSAFRKYGLRLFLFSLFLIRLPPVYILPIKSGLVNSHSLARYLLIVLFAVFMWLLFSQKTKLVIPKTFSWLLGFYLISQSASVLTAVNVEAFLLMYKNIVFALVVLILGFALIKTRKDAWRVVSLLLLTVFVDLVFQAVVYFRINPFFEMSEKILYDKYWEVFDLNLRRNRFFVDIFDASLLPFLFLFALKAKNAKKRVFALLGALWVAFFAFVSNFRIQLIMVFASVLGSLFIFNRNLKRFLVQVVLLAFFLLIAYVVSVRVVGYNALDRLLTPTRDDISTISSRLNYWSQSVEMGLASPFFGVGLGNFYDVLAGKQTVQLSTYDPEGKLTAITDSHPHSIFFGALAETGFLGLISTLAILIYFLVKDFTFIRKASSLSKASMVAFWSLFLYAVVNPPDTVQYLSLFWILRVLVLRG